VPRSNGSRAGNSGFSQVGRKPMRFPVEPTDLRRLRWPTMCWACAAKLPAGSLACWDKEFKRATCAPCLGFLDRGTPGASAAQIAERKRARGAPEFRVRSWDKGADGERRLGRHLEKIRSPWLAVLHDRRIPGSVANIDHIVVGPAALFVIDAKRYKGKVERVDLGGLLRHDWRLVVDGEDRTELIAKMETQVRTVCVALGDAPVPVIPVICFTDSEWSWLPFAFRFGDVRVMWPQELFRFVETEGPLNTSEIRDIERRLQAALPRAA
jgi:hypothetical protein